MRVGREAWRKEGDHEVEDAPNHRCRSLSVHGLPPLVDSTRRRRRHHLCKASARTVLSPPECLLYIRSSLSSTHPSSRVLGVESRRST